MNPQITLFRGAVRRIANDLVNSKIDAPTCIARFRRAAVAAGILTTKRREPGERILDSLAYGRGDIAPGTLPRVLEPVYRSCASGQITDEAFAEQARELLRRLRAPDAADLIDNHQPEAGTARRRRHPSP